MNFETGDLYHIYNQGNNKIPIFYSQENYLFFLKKVINYILPHADILAWCLMPNHFHLMVYVHTLEIEVSEEDPSDGFTPSEAVTKKKRDLNNSIGVLLRSYTRAIHKQEKMSGSLFRNPTHAECLTTPDTTTPSFYNTPYGTVINMHYPEEEYPQVCFNYIHNNPVKARLVKQAEDWEFSSYSDYCGKRNGKLINRKRAEEFGLVI
ncbi:MAG: hypothetical protein PHT07_24595 [Paludibacter sp.]|nr:hypothetical protein [Paludibacter sp.]